MEDLKILKIYLQEAKYPHFTEEELIEFLSIYKNPLLTASKLCILKSNSNSKVTVGPITIEGPGSEYWITLANQYADEYESSKEIITESEAYYINRKNRLDDMKRKSRFVHHVR